MNVRALILDLGNVLVFHDNALLFRRLAERAGLRPEAVEQLVGQSPLWEAANRGHLDGEAIHREVCDRLKVEIPRPELEALWCCHFRPNPPMLSLVEPLAQRVKLLLLSNTNPLHLAYLRRHYPLLGAFARRLFSCELGWVKPERAIYQAALTAADEPADRTALFDDDPGFVAAAAELGIRARLFTGVDAFRRELEVMGIAA